MRRAEQAAERMAGAHPLSRSFTHSPLEPAEQVNVGSLEVAVNHHNNAQAYRNFGSGHGHDEEHENLAIRVGAIGREGRQQNVHCIEHQLDAHEDDDGIAPHQHPRNPNGKQSGSEKDVVLQRHGPNDFGDGLGNRRVHGQESGRAGQWAKCSRPAGKGTRKPLAEKATAPGIPLSQPGSRAFGPTPMR